MVKIKDKKTISLDRWIIDEIHRKHPTSRHNFSLVVSAMLRAVLNSPLIYWKAQAKHHQQLLSAAIYHIENIEKLETGDDTEQEELTIS